MSIKPSIDLNAAVRSNKKNTLPDSEDIDSLLDEALEESFPASDPIAVTIPKSERAVDKEHRRIEGKLFLKSENRNKKAFPS